MTRKEMYTAITAAGIKLHPCNAADAAPANETAVYYMDIEELTGIYADIAEEQPAEIAVTITEAATATRIARRHGGYRERDILNHPHTVERGETWNNDHKVVYIFATTPDPDGYRPGCAVDIVTHSIVG